MIPRNRIGHLATAGIVICFLAIAWPMLLLSPVPFFRYALGGVFIIHLATAGSRREWLYSVMLAGAVAICYRASGGTCQTDLYAALSTVAAFLGLASSIILGWKAIWNAEHRAAFVASGVLPLASIVVGLIPQLLIGLQPRVYDFYLFRFDEALGFQASAVVGRWLLNCPPLDFICRLGYEVLPLAQASVVAVYLRSRVSLLPIYLTMGGAGFLGCALYLLIPAVGPVHVFGTAFTANVARFVPLVTTSAIHLVPRNGLPSLHLTWALLVLWNLPSRVSYARPLAIVFLVVTILATLGTGEHYLVDLIVAVPFAFCVPECVLRAMASRRFSGCHHNGLGLIPALCHAKDAVALSRVVGGESAECEFSFVSS